MKKIKILFLMMSVCFSSYAQDPQLFENNWYLQKVIIDDVEHFPPLNSQIDNVSLNFFTDYNFYTVACQSISSGSITITNDFFNVDSFLLLPDGTCDSGETAIFENIYFNTFFNWTESNNIYYYNIETGTKGFKTLVLTNALNYKAIYGNELLSTQDFDSSFFSIYPNPAKKLLKITNKSNIAINKIKIYDILGRLLLQKNNPMNQLDVSGLAKGLLLVQIETDKGIVTKKIIKQ